MVALTLDDVTLHSTDGVHVRLRRSKTDQEAHGTVTALPYGRDPVTCPPCAYVRWRQVLQAWDAAPENRRRPAQPANRSQSERYAFFVAAAVEASTASSTRASVSAGNCCSWSTAGTGRTRAAVARSANRRNCSLRGTCGTCGAADGAGSGASRPGGAE